MNKNYQHKFYKDRHANTRYAAEKILSMIFQLLPPVKSAVDVGCGVGTWLSVFRDSGIHDIQGFDGDWVEENLLEIPAESFKAVSLEVPLEMERRFDLAISLEVAEHIPGDSAADFISSLTNLSDFVLFSAAIPFQGGKGHVNEQWPAYWTALFKANGYRALDLIRKEIWDDEGIPVWYRQNILLFVKEERLPEMTLPAETEDLTEVPLSLVHPGYFVEYGSKATSIPGTLRLLAGAIKRLIFS